METDPETQIMRRDVGRRRDEERLAEVQQWQMDVVVCMAALAQAQGHLKVWSDLAGQTGSMAFILPGPRPRGELFNKLCGSVAII
ncbi:MAG: hypothetical protein V3W19_08775 [Desulfatiglandales bacterium]